MTNAFQPLMPEYQAIGPLLDKAARLIEASKALTASGGQQRGVRNGLDGVLCSMNAFYSQSLDGQAASPAEIGRALQGEFDVDERIAVRQRRVLAYMQAESMLVTTAQQPGSSPYSPVWVSSIHEALYCGLPAADPVTAQGGVIVPGQFRTQDQVVGQPTAPFAAEITAYLSAWEGRYQTQQGAERAVVAAVCAHQRLLWIHPFAAGNGGVARLQTHLVLQQPGLTGGLWSLVRGLAKSSQQYAERLHVADLPRRHERDGRGALSQEALVAFADYFLDVCLAEVRFMGDLLDMDQFRNRLQELVHVLSGRSWVMGSEKALVRPEAFLPLHYVALTGALPRADFMRMTGLEARMARRVLASLLDWGLLRAQSSRSEVSFNIGQRSLRWLFPGLWGEAEVEG